MTTNIFQEGELQLSFPETLSVYKLDEKGVTTPQGMSLIDLVIEDGKSTLLLEIKDPSNTKSPETERKKYIKRMKNDTLIANELTPKARDSYTFLHLMDKDSNPFTYIVLFGLDAFSNEEALLLGFKDRLLQRLRHEAKEPWKKQYIRDCVVLSITQWRRKFPNNWLLSRKGEKGKKVGEIP